MRKNIYVVSQLAIGDALLCKRYIIDNLISQGYNVVVICNPNNAFIFKEFTTIIENWPLSPKRFKSLIDFKYFLKSREIDKDLDVLIPSGHFLEKLIASLRFRENKIFFAHIKNGLRKIKNNQIIGNYFRFKNSIEIDSFDAYGAHLEFFTKFTTTIPIFSNFYKNNIEKMLLDFIYKLKIKEIFIQKSALVKSKSMSITFYNDLINTLRQTSCTIYIIEDNPKRNQENDFIKHLIPQDVNKLIKSDSQMFFLLDSFLMHLIHSKCNNVFCVISQKFAYDWLPRNVIPVSSIYSLVKKI